MLYKKKPEILDATEYPAGNLKPVVYFLQKHGISTEDSLFNATDGFPASASKPPAVLRINIKGNATMYMGSDDILVRYPDGKFKVHNTKSFLTEYEQVTE